MSRPVIQSDDKSAVDQRRPSREASRAIEPDGWLDRHGDALFRYALLRVRDQPLAEDLVQETLLAGLRSHTRFTQLSSERTWLIGILRHKIIDDYRKRRHQCDYAPAVDSVDESFFTKRGLWVKGPITWRGNPHESLEKERFWAVFRDCLGVLPPHFADAFCLSALEQKTGSEVCEILGLEPTKLWTLMHRARSRLRRCLELNWFERQD